MKSFGITLSRLLLLLLLYAHVVAFAQGKYPQDDIKKREALITQWENQAALQSALEILVIVFGAGITVVQGFQKGWSKPATIAMGAFTSIFSAVNTKVFPTDSRQLRSAVVEGNRLATKLHKAARAMDEATNADARDSFGVELERALGKFDDLDSRVRSGSAAKGDTQTSWLGSPVVYAMAADEACGLKVKSDPARFYFLGTDRNSSVSHAKEQSQRDAVRRAAKELTPKGLDRKSVRDMLEKLAVVEDTGYALDPKGRQYTYCTLIRVNKTALNLLKTAPPVTEIRLAEGHVSRLSTTVPLYLYLRKVQNRGGAVAEVFILESAAREWLNPELTAPAFKAALAKLTEDNGQDVPESYQYREVKKGDILKVKLPGEDVTINFTDVKYAPGCVDFTVDVV